MPRRISFGQSIRLPPACHGRAGSLACRQEGARQSAWAQLHAREGEASGLIDWMPCLAHGSASGIIGTTSYFVDAISGRLL